NRLRVRAGRMGIAIKTQRAKGTSPQRAYSLIERTTGTVLYHDIDGLIDLEAVLSRIVWDRQLARADGPTPSVTTPSCPSCGTPRVGQFRWCRSCGRDFEPMAHIAPRWPPFQLQEPEEHAEPVHPTEEPKQPTDPRIQPKEAPGPPSPKSISARRWRPHVARPHVARPHVPRPHVARPHVALPHVARPHVALPHVARPHVALPHVARHHVARPHVARPHVAL